MAENILKVNMLQEKKTRILQIQDFLQNVAFKYGVEARQIVAKKIQKAKFFNALEAIGIAEAALDADLVQLGLTGKLKIVDAIKTQLEMARQAVWAV